MSRTPNGVGRMGIEIELSRKQIGPVERGWLSVLLSSPGMSGQLEFRREVVECLSGGTVVSGRRFPGQAISGGGVDRVVAVMLLGFCIVSGKG